MVENHALKRDYGHSYGLDMACTCLTEVVVCRSRIGTPTIEVYRRNEILCVVYRVVFLDIFERHLCNGHRIVGHIVAKHKDVPYDVCMALVDIRCKRRDFHVSPSD